MPIGGAFGIELRRIGSAKSKLAIHGRSTPSIARRRVATKKASTIAITERIVTASKSRSEKIWVLNARLRSISPRALSLLRPGGSDIATSQPGTPPEPAIPIGALPTTEKEPSAWRDITSALTANSAEYASNGYCDSSPMVPISMTA